MELHISNADPDDRSAGEVGCNAIAILVVFRCWLGLARRCDDIEAWIHGMIEPDNRCN